MAGSSGTPSRFSNRPTFRMRLESWLSILQVGLVLIGSMSLLLAHGFRLGTGDAALNGTFLVLAALLSLLPLLQWWLSRSRRSFFTDNRVALVVVVITATGALAVGAVIPLSFLRETLGLGSRLEATVAWCQLAVLVWVGVGLLRLFRRISALGWSAPTVLVLSFLTLIVLGTLLLMLPRATPGVERAPFLTALFTATSATCVTGLIVVDTGTYWSVWGQAVTLVLFQLGGLGIMTFGAFFALMMGQGLLVRESALLGQLMEYRVLGNVRRLVASILVFALASEAVGAVLLSGLWADLPLGKRIFYSLYHAVSAFCNAGFTLMSDSFVEHDVRWQVWGILSLLIVVGGIGFTVLDNLLVVAGYRLTASPRRSLFGAANLAPRLNVNSRLALIVMLVLLAAGVAGLLVLETPRQWASRTWNERLALAWFQSVTSRTAGFNTVPIGELSEASQFLLINLMFIGASPGSTAGGVKTVAVATAALALVSLLRGRDTVEAYHRTIPAAFVRRALLIVALGVAVVAASTTLLVAIEDRPGRFLDHLFEATSAFGTVGLSTGITPGLTAAGKCIVLVTMFVGRVGPLTLMMALAYQEKSQRYRYPEEHVVLG